MSQDRKNSFWSIFVIIGSDYIILFIYKYGMPHMFL